MKGIQVILGFVLIYQCMQVAYSAYFVQLHLKRFAQHYPCYGVCSFRVGSSCISAASFDNGDGDTVDYHHGLEAIADGGDNYIGSSSHRSKQGATTINFNEDQCFGSFKTTRFYFRKYFDFGTDLGKGHNNPLVFHSDNAYKGGVHVKMNFYRKMSVLGKAYLTTFEKSSRIPMQKNVTKPQREIVTVLKKAVEYTISAYCEKFFHGNHCMIYCKPKHNYACDNDGNKICANGWYGAECENFCKASSQEPARYYCDNDGRKICLKNWYGSNCQSYCNPDESLHSSYSCNTTTGEKICKVNWYGQNCSTLCVPDDTSYTCDQSTGKKICNGNWYGKDCEMYCKEEDSTEASYTCNQSTGNKVCNVNWYGDDCSIYCKAQNDSTASYVCNNNTGSKVCMENWFTNDCNVFCQPRDNDNGHYTCTANGEKVCFDEYYGKDCKTYCESGRVNFKCNKETGEKICTENWFTKDCSMFCKAQDNSDASYNCDRNTGVKVCNKDWYGSNCSSYCRINSNETGRFVCTQDGVKQCAEHYYGKNCNTYCKKGKTYTCDPETGKKICLPNFIGKECEVPCNSSTSSHLNCNGLAGFCVGKPQSNYDIKSCFQYVACDGLDNGIVINCPKETNFHPDLKNCVWISFYKCKN